MTTEDPVVDENVTPSAEEGGRSREGQTIRNMAADRDLGEVGPRYPSGMNTVEAALSGADENVPDQALRAMHGEAVETSDETTPAEGVTSDDEEAGL